MFFGSKTVQEKDIKRALSRVQHPEKGKSLDNLGMLSGIVLNKTDAGVDVSFVITLNAADHQFMDSIRRDTENAISQIKGVCRARAIFTGAEKPEAPAKPHAHSPKKEKPEYGHLGKVIAVLSGKGGVGKSTVAANLAVAMAKQGLRVGLFDADIYGPSVPKLFGITEKPKSENGKMIPIEKFGVKLMSIGFILEESAPVVWRGLMVMKALRQLLDDVMWGELDILVIDMPPGTGDVQLTLMQTLQLAGGVVVSTPQDLALIDARKAIGMLQKLQIPILGVIENMSMFICPHCDGRSDIFGHGGAADEATRIGAPYLGEIPLTLELRQSADAGVPIVISQPDSPSAKAFAGCVDVVLKNLNSNMVNLTKLA